jgi:hypothetical protein
MVMLIQLVRPLVRTQIQMLTKTPAANSKLVGMVSQWLGYLGVHAEVTRLHTQGDRIQLSLQVGKPEQCTEDEWRKILTNLQQAEGQGEEAKAMAYNSMSPSQKNKVCRLLACVLQASSDDFSHNWVQLKPQLLAMGLDATMVAGIESAARVPMPMELLIENLEPEVASFALSKAINIALLDQHITQAEDDALNVLLNALKQKTYVAG